MILTDALLVLDATDISGLSNTFAAEFARTDLDDTRFGATGKMHRAGLMDFTASAEGIWEEGAEATDVIESPIVHDFIVAADRAPGTPAFVAGVEILSSSRGGAVDTLAPWSANLASRRGVHRGVVAYDLDTDTDAAGPGLQLGALASGESMVATIHTLAVDDTATVVVQSHTSNGWSSPTDEDDVEISAPGVTSVVIDGVVARTWWRISVQTEDPFAAVVTLHRLP